LIKEYTFTPKLKLLVDHLKAVRALDEYVNGELKKDMQGLSNHLQQDLNSRVFRPAGWEDLYSSDGCLYSSPQSKRWRVVRDDVIAIEIDHAWPVQADDEPSVGLYVPANWKKQGAFIEKLKPPTGFEHVSQYPDGELTEETSIFKYLRYTSFIRPKGLFDSIGFIDAFRKATKSLVAMKKRIDAILESLA
jgi:hypothetical protein